MPNPPTIHPEPFIRQRLDRLRAALKAAGIFRSGDGEAFLITYFPDVSWLTGFEGEDSFVLLTPDRIVILSDSRYAEQLSREAPWLDAMIVQSKSMLDRIFLQAKRLKIHKLALQPEALTLKLKAALAAKFKEKHRPLRLVEAPDVIVKLRHLKDPHEVAIMEQSIRIAENAFLALRPQLTPGMTENEIAGLLEFEMRKRGASGSSFDTIVGAGPNGSLPHYRPAQVPLQNNSPLLIDWGARYRGYCSDLTRVLFLGKVPDKIREIYKIVLDAQLAAIAAIKPGVKCKAVDRAARSIIEKAGYGPQFGHGTGHGLGRDIHEALSCNRLSKQTLEEGMVITVEPGIYLPNLGGVRIEDDILVTNSGHSVLSSLPKDLPWAQL